MNKQLIKRLEDRKVKGNFRSLPRPTGLIDFCSNDYLGLAKRPLPKEENTWSPGATGSRLISGNSKLIETVEEEIAHFHKAETGLIFNSGYVANLGILSSLPQRGDTLIYDELAHASIRDGIRLSNAKTWSFKHNDTEDLTRKIQKATGNIYVIVESIYSMDGDAAPLKEIVKICQSFEADLIVDEAHAVGVFGENGEGLVVEQNLEHQVFARIVTFGKSLGTHGAIVLGSTMLRTYLINFCRPFIYTTALPDASIQQVRLAYRQMKNSDAIQKLKGTIEHFRNWKKQSGVGGFIESQSAIQSLLIPGNLAAKKLSQDLKEKGVDVRAILHPTVAEGKERLRICLHAFNRPEELEMLYAALVTFTKTPIKKSDAL